MTIKLTSQQLKDFWDKEDNIIAFECSDVDIKVPSANIILHNTNTCKSKKYEYYKLDRSDSGLDVAGWWYRAIDGQKLLLIND